jgi:hypothetical protein
MKMEAASSSKKFVTTYQMIECHISEDFTVQCSYCLHFFTNHLNNHDFNLYQDHCENLKLCNVNTTMRCDSVPTLFRMDTQKQLSAMKNVQLKEFQLGS